jgi:hypothetical protein
MFPTTSGTQRHTETHRDTQTHTETHRDTHVSNDKWHTDITQTHTETHRDTHVSNDKWHTETHRDTQTHTETHRDTQRHRVKATMSLKAPLRRTSTPQRPSSSCPGPPRQEGRRDGRSSRGGSERWPCSHPVNRNC